MGKRCQHDALLEPVRGKWKAELVYLLRAKPRRLSELEDSLPGSIPRVLKRQLRNLEEDGIVQRTSHGEMPPRVEYSLTEQGQSLHSLLCAINTAAEEYLSKIYGL